MATSNARGAAITGDERKVIFASSLGTVFEWYDFFVFGTLASFVTRPSSRASTRPRPTSPRCSCSPPASSCGRSARWCSVAWAT